MTLKIYVWKYFTKIYKTDFKEHFNSKNSNSKKFDMLTQEFFQSSTVKGCLKPLFYIWILKYIFIFQYLEIKS